jgi:hypothetical protein
LGRKLFQKTYLLITGSAKPKQSNKQEHSTPVGANRHTYSHCFYRNFADFVISENKKNYIHKKIMAQKYIKKFNYKNYQDNRRPIK